MYVDTHIHFDIVMSKLRCREEELLAALKEKGIVYGVQVSIAVDSFQWAYDFAKKYRRDGILFTLGLHPSSIARGEDLTKLERFTDKVIKEEPELLFGIGECGLDYYRFRQEKEMQEESFRRQIFLAKKYNRPVIVHSRDAAEDTLSILKEMQINRGIMHCFQGDSRTAKGYLDLGFYISFAGNLTYNNAKELHDAASYVPADRILLETDAPFLTPVPLRGKTNRPEYVIHTYEFLARQRKWDMDYLSNRVLENFQAILSANSE